MNQDDLNVLLARVSKVADAAGKKVTSPRLKNGLATVTVYPAFDGRSLSMDERKRQFRQIGGSA
jgi:hypothetical protein